MKEIPMIEGRTVALIAGFAVGLGLVVHPIFFIVALGVVGIAAAQWMMMRVCNHRHA